ncbi:MAG: DUF3068 domain-containing protein [Actinobacteria bacterium]|nr:DUF3068 domain-containing protein [Actinomycetota bacterium]
MGRQRPFRPHLFIGLGLIALAGLLHPAVDFLLTPLPAGYAAETRYTADTRFRGSPTAAWVSAPLIARRTDQTLTVSGGISIIQGDVHWITEDGTPSYEHTTLYGVNRRTRMNVPGYGDADRTGQFLFPQHVRQTTYEFWDPYYLGPRTATFSRVEEVEGLTTYVFDYTAVDIDATGGYTFLPDVPERYRALSDGLGTLWIEPLSGVVVDFEDEGVSYFVDAKTDERVADLYHWSPRYTPETRAAQLARARAARSWHMALEYWLPAGLLLAGLLWVGIGWRRHRS